MFNPEGLEKARRAAGIKQTDLANMLGIGQSAISLFECGVRKPSGDVAAAICHILNIPISSLYFFENK